MVSRLSPEEQFLSTQCSCHPVLWQTVSHHIIIIIFNYNIISLLHLTLRKSKSTFLGVTMLVFLLGPLLPRVIFKSPLRGQPSAKCHPRCQPILGLAVLCRLGRLLDSNPGLQLHNLMSLSMSHHCSLVINSDLQVNKHHTSTKLSSFCLIIGLG